MKLYTGILIIMILIIIITTSWLKGIEPVMAKNNVIVNNNINIVIDDIDRLQTRR